MATQSDGVSDISWSKGPSGWSLTVYDIKEDRTYGPVTKTVGEDVIDTTQYEGLTYEGWKRLQYLDVYETDFTTQAHYLDTMDILFGVTVTSETNAEADQDDYVRIVGSVWEDSYRSYSDFATFEGSYGDWSVGTTLAITDVAIDGFRLSDWDVAVDANVHNDDDPLLGDNDDATVESEFTISFDGQDVRNAASFDLTSRQVNNLDGPVVLQFTLSDIAYNTGIQALTVDVNGETVDSRTYLSEGTVSVSVPQSALQSGTNTVTFSGPDATGGTAAHDSYGYTVDSVSLSAPTDGDYDDDGISNWNDACERDPEDPDGYQDGDGCPENNPPNADFTYSPSDPASGESVAFDASASSDPEGDSLDYEWTFGDGSSATGRAPSHTYATSGTYDVTLTVRDGNGNADSVTRSVAVDNPAPNPGFSYSPSTPLTGETVTFDAAGTSDPNDGSGSLTYDWSFGDGSSATGQTASHSYDSAGSYTATLTVVDDEGVSASTSRAVTVETRAPRADLTASPSSISEGESTTLDASGSSDPDGSNSALTYTWSVVSQPSGASAATPSGASGSVTLSTPGTYEFRVTVSDGTKSDSATTTVSVGDVNAAPSADLTASPSSITEGESTTLDASGSSDPDGSNSALTYTWSVVSQPSGASAATPSGASGDVTLSTPGTYEFRVTVSDGARSDSATATVSVGDTNAAPTADAGADRTVDVGAAVELDATGSSDPDGDALSYSWTQTDGPSVTLADDATATPTFTAPSVSSETALTFQVTVRDGAGATSSDAVTVTVSPGSTNRTLTMRVGGADLAAAPGSRVAVPIVVDRAPDGLTRVENVDVSVADASVAFVDVTTPLDNSSSDFPAENVDVNGVDRSHVDFSTSALTNTSAPGPGEDILVGTVVLTAANTTGTTTLSLDAGRGYNQSALSGSAQYTRVEFRTVDGSLTVSTNPFPGRDPMPRDAMPSKPGYEDFDGDGEFTFLDVVEVLMALGDVPADDTAKVNAVDFNDDGEFTFLDVVELLFRL